MDVSTLSSLSSVSSTYLDDYAKTKSMVQGEDDSFSAVLDSMLKAVNETNDLQNQAEEEQIRFALGLSDNTHDLLIAESKAAVALQYTVAVRDKVVESYKEIMNMQI